MFLTRKAMRRTVDGFSLLELVVTVGIILVLSVSGIIGYSNLRRQALMAYTDNAAKIIFTKLVANKLDDDPSTTVYNASEEYLKSSKNDKDLTILLLKSKDRDLNTVLVINTAVTPSDPQYFYPGYFYAAYESEESPEQARDIAKAAIKKCIDANGCSGVSNETFQNL